MALFDFQHPFFEPLWRRVAVVVVCVGWGLFELSTGATVWAVLFIGIGVWAGYEFFIDRDRPGGDS